MHPWQRQHARGRDGSATLDDITVTLADVKAA